MGLKVQFDVMIRGGTFDVVQPEYFRDGPEGLETESGTDARFGSASDEELDVGDPVRIAGEDGEDGRGGFLVLALIKGVDDNER